MQRITVGSDVKLCENGALHGVCNWLLPVDSSEKLCMACRMNRTIPELGATRNLVLWGRTEMAKRRLIYRLLRLKITLPSKIEDPQNGLAFDIISTLANQTVTTGHLNGVITINLEEADDTYRQINRQQLGESNRTLLGHFRHESAHYLWHRYLSPAPWNDPCRLAFRERFGDEWTDYASALKSYYERGVAVGWEENYITPYASSHPWEDWAETWAHYLQIQEGLETCESLGIQVQHIDIKLVLLPAAAGAIPSILPQSELEDGAFLAWIQRWMCLSTVLNEIADSLGEAALYPFVISVPVVQKLRLAHYFARTWQYSDHKNRALV